MSTPSALDGTRDGPEPLKSRGETHPVEERRTVSEKLVAQIDSSAVPETLTSSPDGKRVAYVAGVGTKQFVVVDGKEGKQYDGIGKGILELASDFYLGIPVFSPDSQRVAYVAREGERWFVVIDGKEEKQYDDLGPLTLTFSPDSKRVAYVARVGTKQFVMVVDGKEGKQYEWIGGLVFSPDSKRLAYWAGVGGRRVVVVDGEEGEAYPGVAQGMGPSFLPDIPFSSVPGWWVASTYCEISFSPNSRRFAYVGSRGAKWIVVVDGKEENAYDWIGDGLVFSPDSQRVACYVGQGEGPEYHHCVVVDGKEENAYDEVAEGSLRFSPDGRRFAYVAKEWPKWFVVVDGKEGKHYDSLSTGDPVFSPDSRRVAYHAVAYHALVGEGERIFAVVDGKEGKQYKDMGDLVFSPDSKRLAYWAGVGDKWLVLVDDSEGAPYDDLESTIVFDSATAFHYLAARKTANGKDILCVAETIN
ncbi:MAG: hypothetical protein ABSG92_04000 [Conexivisphaerales archaeon]|jgi:Tol biopolymer transport system component